MLISLIVTTKQLDPIEYLYQHGKTAKACCQEMGLSITTHGRFISGEMQTGSIAYSAWKRYLLQKEKAERAAARAYQEEALLQQLRVNRAAAAAAAATAAIATTAALQAAKDTETGASAAAIDAIKRCTNDTGLAAEQSPAAENVALPPSAGIVAVLVPPPPPSLPHSADRGTGAGDGATKLSNAAVPITSTTCTSAGPSSSSSAENGNSYCVKAPVTTA